jgi:hypothetical protein
MLQEHIHLQMMVKARMESSWLELPMELRLLWGVDAASFSDALQVQVHLSDLEYLVEINLQYHDSQSLLGFP